MEDVNELHEELVERISAIIKPKGSAGITIRLACEVIRLDGGMNIITKDNNRITGGVNGLVG